ncbi:MAG: hypothetical protein JRD68_00185 [Deltaproteobacteria bacterium]|nr:hypothetical protein [Deltaproteobacteria bacterium]
MTDNLIRWDAMKRPPPEVLKKIEGGRLKNKTDISPQWRYQIMTEQYGPCGVGWKYDIVRLWTEPGPKDQIFAFAQVNVYVKDGETWSDPIPGIGGSMLVELEKGGLHANDEGFKMAVTDALGVALKMLGVAADIYLGSWDGSKYRDDNSSGSGNKNSEDMNSPNDDQRPAGSPDQSDGNSNAAESGHLQSMWAHIGKKGWTEEDAKAWIYNKFDISTCTTLTSSEINRAMKYFNDNPKEKAKTEPETVNVDEGNWIPDGAMIARLEKVGLTPQAVIDYLGSSYGYEGHAEIDGHINAMDDGTLAIFAQDVNS